MRIFSVRVAGSNCGRTLLTRGHEMSFLVGWVTFTERPGRKVMGFVFENIGQDPDSA